MEAPDRLKKIDNLHIVFWLIKDSCWMLELRWLGAIVMVPTLYLALHIIFKTKDTLIFYLNIAIFFWILANSFWMMMEFFFNDHYRCYAAIPFALGFLFVGIFYYKSIFTSKKNS